MMKQIERQETVELAIFRLNKEMAKVTGMPIGSYLDWLEEHVENYRHCYDEDAEFYEEAIINDLENEAGKFIEFWKDNFGND